MGVAVATLVYLGGVLGVGPFLEMVTGHRTGLKGPKFIVRKGLGNFYLFYI